MKGIHSITIGAGTLEEAPFAYKPMTEIIDAIGDTAAVDKIIRPVYNYKAKKE